MNDVALFDFEDLVGEECDFYGVDGQRFRLDDTTYEAIETSTGECEIAVSNERIEGLPIARVIVQSSPYHSADERGPFEDLYALEDLHCSHIWLEVGTTYEGVPNDDDPVFIFEYSPKGPAD